MCQLLGMNCNVPTDICFSFTGFQARGGATDIHRDGWGIAFFEGRGVRMFLDPESGQSVAELAPARKNLMSHRGKALAQLTDALRGSRSGTPGRIS